MRPTMRGGSSMARGGERGRSGGHDVRRRARDRRGPRPPQPLGAGGGAGGARLAAAGHLHPRRARRAAAGAEQVPGDAADHAAHHRQHAVGAAALRADAAPRPQARASSSARWAAGWGRLLCALALVRGSFGLFLLGSLLSGLYMSAQGFFRFAATDGAARTSGRGRSPTSWGRGSPRRSSGRSWCGSPPTRWRRCPSPAPSSRRRR